MASQDVKYEVPEPATEVVDGMSLNEITALGHRQQQLSVTPVSEDLNFPSVETILSTLEGELGPSAAVREHLDLSVEEQSQMYRALQNVLSKSEENEGSFDVEELRASLEHADAAARQGQRSLQALQGVIATLEKLWYSRSRYMAEAAEALANGSREREICLHTLQKKEVADVKIASIVAIALWSLGDTEVFPSSHRCKRGGG
jgi:hypothetical protein